MNPLTAAKTPFHSSTPRLNRAAGNLPRSPALTPFEEACAMLQAEGFQRIPEKGMRIEKGRWVMGGTVGAARFIKVETGETVEITHNVAFSWNSFTQGKTHARERGLEQFVSELRGG